MSDGLFDRSWLRPEVINTIQNDSVDFIPFLFRQSTYKEKFWILDCGLWIYCIAALYLI
jgi:hypothetical protein